LRLAEFWFIIGKRLTASIMKKTKLALVTIALGVSLAAACGQTAQPGANTPAANTAANANAAKPAPAESPKTEVAAMKSGKDLYTINCMTCHKDSGKGGKVTVEGKTLNPDDLTSANMKAKSDEKLYSYIADGIVDEGMPAFKDKLKPEEIKSVVAHLRELQGK
jgi:mono/diheme cytochrome c family protein